jgi:diaminopropionate ammonia-lyase
VGEGYATILHELHDQLESVPDVVVVPLGVGAFGAAVAVGMPGDVGEPPFLLGVEPDDAACVQAAVERGEVVEVPGPHRSMMAGLNCGLASRTALPALMDRFDGFTTVSDEACASALRDLAELGFDCGECGAATLAGLISVVGHVPEVGGDATVVLLCTEGVTDPENFRRIVGRDPHEVALAGS